MSGPYIQRRLVFGRDRDPGVTEEVIGRTKTGSLTSNPCVVAFGPGPTDKVCGDCSHLFRRGDVAGTYYGLEGSNGNRVCRLCRNAASRRSRERRLARPLAAVR